MKMNVAILITRERRDKLIVSELHNRCMRILKDALEHSPRNSSFSYM